MAEIRITWREFIFEDTKGLLERKAFLYGLEIEAKEECGWLFKSGRATIEGDVHTLNRFRKDITT